MAVWGTPSVTLVYRQHDTSWDIVRVPNSLIAEAEPPACSNGVDDDHDGIEDLKDRGCAAADDGDEDDPAAPPACDDARGNDGDQTIDFPADPECEAAGDPLEGEPPVCDQACAVLHGDGTAKHVDISGGGVIAARWSAATDTLLTRLEAYSGALAGPAWVAIYAHDPASDEPGAELARADFTLDSAVGWQGATLSRPVIVPQGARVWWTFGYPKDPQPPYAESGTPVDVRVTPLGQSGWRHVSWQAIMMRTYCCAE